MRCWIGGRSFLARETDCNDIETLEERFSQRTHRAAEVIAAVLGDGEKDGKDG